MGDDLTDTYAYRNKEIIYCRIKNYILCIENFSLLLHIIIHVLTNPSRYLKHDSHMHIIMCID